MYVRGDILIIIVFNMLVVVAVLTVGFSSLRDPGEAVQPPRLLLGGPPQRERGGPSRPQLHRRPRRDGAVQPPRLLLVGQPHRDLDFPSRRRSRGGGEAGEEQEGGKERQAVSSSHFAGYGVSDLAQGLVLATSTELWSESIESSNACIHGLHMYREITELETVHSAVLSAVLLPVWFV